MLTRLEVEALSLGLAEIRLAGDPALAKAADGAMAKIIDTSPDRVQAQALDTAFQVYRFEKRAPAHLANLREAIWDEHAVDIRYTDRENTKTSRRILPLSVVFPDNALMCFAFCTQRQGFRRFHVDAMSDLQVSAESFRPRHVALLRQMPQEMRKRT